MEYRIITMRFKSRVHVKLRSWLFYGWKIFYIYEQFKLIRARTLEKITASIPVTSIAIEMEARTTGRKARKNKVKPCSRNTPQLDGNTSETGLKIIGQKVTFCAKHAPSLFPRSKTVSFVLCLDNDHLRMKKGNWKDKMGEKNAPSTAIGKRK